MAQQPITLRVRQRRRRRLMLLAGILVLLAGSVLGFLLLSPGNDLQQARDQPPGTVQVPIIAVTIPAGKTIPQTAIRYRYLEPRHVPSDALLNLNQIIGRVALRDVPRGVYLREDDLALYGAPSGLSALARPGKRVVVVPAEQLHAAPNHLEPGDRVDVLALSIVGGSGAGTGSAVERSAATIEGGGSQPGDPNSRARQLARSSRSGLGPQLPISAVLLSEDAEILYAPDPYRRGVRPRPGGTHVALQMAPDEAHATTLALASGQQLRFVYRPFNDRSRITPVRTAGEFTHPPRDIRRIDVYNGITHTSEYAIID